MKSQCDDNDSEAIVSGPSSINALLHRYRLDTRPYSLTESPCTPAQVRFLQSCSVGTSISRSASIQSTPSKSARWKTCVSSSKRPSTRSRPMAINAFTITRRDTALCSEILRSSLLQNQETTARRRLGFHRDPGPTVLQRKWVNPIPCRRP
jgi:hypothetical protein